MSKTNPHDGSDFDDFLKAEGIYEEVTAGAIMRRTIRQIRDRMEACKVNEAELAKRVSTSRAQIHRLLAPTNSSATVETLVRVAHALGAGLQVSLVSPKKIAGKPIRKKDVATIVSATVQENFRQAKGNEGTKQTLPPGRPFARRR